MGAAARFVYNFDCPTCLNVSFSKKSQDTAQINIQSIPRSLLCSTPSTAIIISSSKAKRPSPPPHVFTPSVQRGHRKFRRPYLLTDCSTLMSDFRKNPEKIWEFAVCNLIWPQHYISMTNNLGDLGTRRGIQQRSTWISLYSTQAWDDHRRGKASRVRWDPPWTHRGVDSKCFWQLCKSDF